MQSFEQQDFDLFFASITGKETHSTNQRQPEKEQNQKQCIGFVGDREDQYCDHFQSLVDVADIIPYPQDSMMFNLGLDEIEEIDEDKNFSEMPTGKQEIICELAQKLQQAGSKVQYNHITEKILKSFDIKSKKQKNTNFPKFLVRLLQRHFEKVGKATQNDWEKLKFIHSRIKRLKYRNKNMNISIIKEIVGDEVTLEQEKVCSRRVVRKVLRNRIKKQIIQNNHIYTKKNYMIASKVYALRCQSGGLVDRVKSK